MLGFRILAGVALALSVLFLPFWASIAIALAWVVAFPRYVEVIPLFLASDLLFAAPIPGFAGVTLVSTAIGIALFAGGSIVRQGLRFADER